MEEYLRSLQKQLKDFPAEEQAALMDEIKGHIESGENDPRMGSDENDRRDKLTREMGSPEDMGTGFRRIYRPGRLLDYMLIVIPFLLYPYLNAFYASSIMPRYAGGALLLDVILHLPLVFVGLLRRSAAVTLFWAAILISQLFIITGRLYGYYGAQTVFWDLMLLSLIFLVAKVIRNNHGDLLVVAFGFVLVGMAIAGGLLNTLAMISPFSPGIWRGASGLAQVGANGGLDRSLLNAYLHLRDVAEWYSVLALALFFIPYQRGVRWVGLILCGACLGLGHRYLLDAQTEQNLMAPWIYISWVILPFAVTFSGWWLERRKQAQMRLGI